MDAKLAKIYYSPQGYWKGVSAIKKLAEIAKVPENVVKQWLYKQAIWQIYLPAPRHIPRPKFNVATPNSVHQADLLFLPHDKLPHGRKIYKYALTVVDIASRYKEAEPLTSKNSDEVAKAFQAIYIRSPLTWPQMLQVDPGREFMGGVTKEMEKHKTYIRHGRTEIHRDHASRLPSLNDCVVTKQTFWIVLLHLFLFKFRQFLSTVGFSNEDNCCLLQGIGKLIKEKLSKGIFKVD